ncbi:Common central domain of tyrosinase domain containing protein [Tylopilus felleus]
MAQAYPVIGIEGTGVHPRLDLRELQKNDIQFSLFIRAMTKLENTNSAEPEDRQKPNSWWQMASIHGLPYNPWSGDPDGPQKEDPQSEWGAALFPPWHRVLCMLIEQAMVNEAIAIARQLEAKDWVESAKALRFPFWDWTDLEAAKEGIPKICQETEVEIVNPDGSRSQVPNPLNHYKYAASPGVVPALPYMADWTRTYRWADRNENPTKEMYDQAAKAFSEGTTLPFPGGPIDLPPVTWLRQKVSSLFSYDLTVKDGYGPNMWAYFAGTGAEDHNVEPPMPVMPSSLEEPHNMVHLNTGGNGTMSANEYAGFDPIFFLHHCNVDRIYAFWEYVYPEYWIGNGWKNGQTGQIVPFVTDEGTFWQDSGSTIDHSTPLHPFRSKSSDYWTSDSVRGLLPTSPVNKYYTYPPIIGPNNEKVQVDDPYDKFQNILLNQWGQNLKALALAHDNLPFSPLPLLGLLLKKENNLVHLRQFAIVGLLPEFAFTGSYRLEVYLLPRVAQLAAGLFKGASGVLQEATGFGLGILQEGASLVEEAGTHVVNSINVLGRSDPDRCAACRERRAAGSHIRGFMHVDPRIILYMIASVNPTQLGSITGLAGLSVLIQGSLGMRLVRPDGTKIAAAEPDFTNEAPLDEAKSPKLTLSSHTIKFDPEDPAHPIEFGEHTTHGAFGANRGWKVT